MQLSDIRAEFPALDDIAYLNTATMAVGSRSARQVLEHAVERWSAGRFDWTESERAGDEARAVFAGIIGARVEEVALVPAASVGAAIVAHNLPDAQRGENVVVADIEFSSNYFPWLLLKERGYTVHTVSSGDGLSVDAYERMTDGGTRLIAVSAVQSSNGYRADLAGLSALAARSGARLFVDASQAAGAVPIDVIREGVDYLAAASHKFLLGCRGFGYLFVRQERLAEMHPVVPGWKAARKPLESFYGPMMDLSATASKLDASLPWFSALAERASLGLFTRFGIDAILERNADLSRRLHEKLADSVTGFTPFEPASRSTIVSLPLPSVDTVMARLREAGVVATARAGRLRLSVHFYNSDEDIDRAAAILAANG